MDRRGQALKGRKRKGQPGASPDQKALFIASHKLVANKSFGWSRLFADLEAVLPGSVSASRIEVQNIYKDGERIKAELEFAVLSRDYPAVMEMIQRMNNSGIFQAELRGQDLQKNERITFTEYTLQLFYTPAYGYSPAPPTQVAQNGREVISNGTKKIPVQLTRPEETPKKTPEIVTNDYGLTKAMLWSIEEPTRTVLLTENETIVMEKEPDDRPGPRKTAPARFMPVCGARPRSPRSEVAMLAVLALYSSIFLS